MCEEIQNCCRICLDSESDQVSILGDPTISVHMKSCLSVTVSPHDHLPKTICVSCVTLLKDFYNFQLNARCSQDWLESSVHEKLKKSSENKMLVQPLPDSEYNSDSLLEFLNNTENIEEYLNNLGKEDIPCIVNMLDKNEHTIEAAKANLKAPKVPSPKKKDAKKLKLGVDKSDPDFQTVKNLVIKETEPKGKTNQGKIDKNTIICFGCKILCDTVQKLLQHLSICDLALRTCVYCYALFDSKQQMQQHSIIHNTSVNNTNSVLTFTCNCGDTFVSKERLLQHHKTCRPDYAASVGCVYRCKECKDTFTDRFDLYKHAKEHIIKLEEKVCDICGHTFMGNEALIKHRIRQHEQGERLTYRCKVCGYTSPDRKETYIHVRNHTTKRQSPPRHLCETCGKSFAILTSLNRHVQQHGMANLSCNICGLHFRDTKAHSDHMKEHIEMTICEKCGESVNNYKLGLHTCG
ncbi:zinc finger protein 639-like [Anticarsia gemmatalis]|uniref:zinc finger protein 639-like n=1 Tax=Anticarsia gemmatalis TaxID=129554 RepID=UPI003F774F8F